MELNSPAKLNLFFRVLGKREDGFHEIASLYQAITYFDHLSLELASQDQLTCTNPAIPPSENLALKALQCFRNQTGIESPVSIHIEKNIPLQSGLGGGSSNAATTLWGLNELFDRPLSTDELIKLGGLIGSDVPFFFSLGTAYCTGRGERLERLPPLPGRGVELFFPPGKGLSTPEVYKTLDLSTLEQKDPEELLKQWQEGLAPLHNDLERSAFSLAPALKKWRHDHSVMTGSGSTFFSPSSDDDAPYAWARREPACWYYSCC